jgi:Ca2+-binding RTX toxin-like protein
MRFRHLFTSRSGAATRARHTTARRAQLFLEPLETRVTPTVTLQNGVLTVTGDNPAMNQIALDLNSVAGVSVTLNGHSFAFGPLLVSSIVVSPGAGNNAVDVNALPRGIPITLNCSGNDHVRLGGSTDTLDFLTGLVTVQGNGSTELDLNDTIETDFPVVTYTITAGSVARKGFGGVIYVGTRSLGLLGAPDSTYYVLSTSCQTAIASQGGPGANTFDIGTGNLDAIQGLIWVYPGSVPHSVPDVFVLHDETCPTNQTYNSIGYSILRDGSDLISVEVQAAVTLNEGSGNNSFEVNEGNPAYGQFLLPFPLTINGGAGHNTVGIEDSYGSVPICDVTSSTVWQAGAALLTYSAVQNLDLGDFTSAEIDVLSIAAGTKVSIVSAALVIVGNVLDGLGDIKGGFDDSYVGTLMVDDTFNTLAGTQYLVTGDSVVRQPGLIQIGYSHIGNLVLDAGSGSNDSISVIGTSAVTTTTIYAGPGTDNVQFSGGFSGTLNNVNGPVTINGQGNTTATLLDQSTIDPETYTLTGTPTGASITRSGFSLTTSNLASLALFGSSGGNQFIVTAAPGSTAVTLQGGSGTNTLTGPDAAPAPTMWAITGAGAGTIGKEVSFTGMTSLVGGAGNDVFKFSAGGSIAGTIDGGAAPLHQGNWLDYSAITTPVTVNLQTGSATEVAGGITNIQNVHGGAGGNTLTGNSQGNILIGGAGNDRITGGTGASLLIGDLGADTIIGGCGSGGDILIGGATSFDTMTAANEKALMSILAEWQSADSYATRFTDIDTGAGGGLNGTAKLNFGTTVTDDGAANTITAAVSGTALDWFFKGAHDVLHNVEPGEHINNNTPAAFKDRTVSSPIPEGGVATLSGIVTDPDPGDSFTLVVNWGDGTPVHTYAFPPSSHGQRVSGSHLYRDEGNYTIALSWTDPTGPANHATLGVTVTEAAPVVQAGGDATLKQDGVLDRAGSFTDPSADTWTATVDYGDGTGPQTLTLHGHDFHLHHKYQQPGTYQVVVTVTDDDGVTGTAAFTVTLG